MAGWHQLSMLVGRHAGTIRAESDGPGQGSSFHIELPAKEPPHETPMPDINQTITSSSDLESPRRRVLLVEDHEDTLSAMSFLLGIHFDVVTATTGKEARARAAEGSFDLVVSDIGLPDEKGYELMAFLKQQYGLKGIALTGFGMEEDVARSQQAGFLTHLTKPVEYPALEKAIRKALE